MKIPETKLKYIKFINDWLGVRDAAMTTICDESIKEPNSLWKRGVLMAEKPPIRKMIINFKWEKVPYWVAMHFIRSYVGDGATWYDGAYLGELKDPDLAIKSRADMIPLEGYFDVQALINISRKALCNRESLEVREYWQSLINEIKRYQPEIATAMVPECVYRGFCPEISTCGFIHSKTYKKHRRDYCRDYIERKDGKIIDAVTGTVHCNYTLEKMNEGQRRIFAKHQNQVPQPEYREDQDNYKRELD